jgi:ABC-type Fe3+-hydroxamate transport system substrate-binding protein
MKLTAFAATAALSIALSGCATIIDGTTQAVSVNTTPEEGASCTLVNSQGTWYLTSPGSTTVHKTKTDLDVTCTKPGYKPGHVVSVSHFTGKTAANLIAGGVVGMGVDAASGANYKYDPLITVPLGDREMGQTSAPRSTADNGEPTS